MNDQQNKKTFKKNFKYNIINPIFYTNHPYKTNNTIQLITRYHK